MHDEMSDYIMRLRDKIHRHIRYTNAIMDKFFFLNIQISICIRYHYEYSILDFIFHFTIAFLHIEKVDTRHQELFSQFFVKRN